MASMFEIMAGAFPSGGGYDSSQDDAYYQAQLQEYLRQQKYRQEMEARAYAEQQARQLQEQLPGVIDQTMQTPGYAGSPAMSAAMQLLKGTAKIGSPLMVDPIQQMLTKGQAGLVSAGTPTQKMKEFELAQQNELFNKWLNEQRKVEIPAQQQNYDRIMELRRRGDVEGAQLLEQMVNPRNPNQQADIESAKMAAKKDTEAAVMGVINAPKTLAAYDDMVGQTNTMLKNINNMRQMMQKNPNVVGWGSYLGYLPETEQRAFANNRQTLVSGLAMENLQKLKQLSPTGASGFGALSYPELLVLQDSIAKLDNASDPASVNAALAIIEEKLQKVKEAAVRSFAADSAWFQQNKGLAPFSSREVQPPINDFTDDFLKKRDLINAPAPTPGGGNSVKWGDLK